MTVFVPVYLDKQDGKALAMLIRCYNHDHPKPIKHKKIQEDTRRYKINFESADVILPAVYSKW